MTGTNLLVFGLGYSVRHFITTRGAGLTVAGTVRAPDKARRLSTEMTGVDVLLFDDREAVTTRLASADTLLVSIPPAADDPALARYGDAIADAAGVRRIVYLSTIGVYGDHEGAWVDEDAMLRPVSGRNRARVEAEARWLALASARRSVHVLRLAGIYGPGRNQIENLRAGTARRIIKDGQVFNRIHVEDISRSIDACLATDMPSGPVNVTDDEPAPPQDVVTFGAGLLGIEPPAPVAFEDAPFNAMARSFWSQNKRVGNAKLRRDLGVDLAYPTYREGLRALV